MINQVISARLKNFRKDRGMTQKQLASKLEVALSVIAGAETKRGVSKNLAIKLAQFSGISVEYWLNPDSKMYNTQNSKKVLQKLIDQGLIKDVNDINKDKEILNIINKALKADIELLLMEKKI